jgi:8-amino-7-oxononanoate synthase
MTEPEPLQQIDRTYVRYRGRKLSYFSGCDYFRLSSHPAVTKAVREAVDEFGLNVSASRLTTGNHKLYQALESELARFFGVEDALLVASGYLAGSVVAQALAGTFSHVLIDESAHPALQDAAALLDCPVLEFKHRNVDDFVRTVTRIGKGARPIVLSDGMFPFDGAIAPLKEYLKHLPRDGLLLVDDAHGAGVLGKTGKGTIEHEGLNHERVIQCITLSKAFGAYGGAILGSRRLRERILKRSRIFRGSTPIPLPLANAALAALKVLKTDRLIRARLLSNSVRVKIALHRNGLTLAEAGPIIPIQLPNSRDTILLKRRLLAAHIFPPFLKYPGGPEKGCFRFVVSSEHSRNQLDRLLEVLTSHPGLERNAGFIGPAR